MFCFGIRFGLFTNSNGKCIQPYHHESRKPEPGAIPNTFSVSKNILLRLSLPGFAGKKFLAEIE
jgi:hypothetical protein